MASYLDPTGYHFLRVLNWIFEKIVEKKVNKRWLVGTKYESIKKNPPKESLIPCRYANGTWLRWFRRRNQEKLLWRLITGLIFVLLQAVDSSTHVAPQRQCYLVQHIEFIIMKSIRDNLRCVPVPFFHPVCVCRRGTFQKVSQVKPWRG